MDDKGLDNRPEFEVPAAERGGEARQERAIEAKPAAETTHELPKHDPGAAQPTTDPQTLAQPAATVMPAEPAAASVKAGQKAAKDKPVDQKQWVAKAKSVIAKTQNDPHAQASAISQVKADYIEANFNKQIKVNETG